MQDVLVSSEKLLERLGREEQQLKRIGLNAQAAVIRSAITILIREAQEPQKPPSPAPLDPST
jgi:hypothetical protein